MEGELRCLDAGVRRTVSQGDESVVHSIWTQSRVHACYPCKDAQRRGDRHRMGMLARWLFFCSLTLHRQGILWGEGAVVCAGLQNLLFKLLLLRVKQHQIGTSVPGNVRLWLPQFRIDCSLPFHHRISHLHKIHWAHHKLDMVTEILPFLISQRKQNKTFCRFQIHLV